MTLEEQAAVEVYVLLREAKNLLNEAAVKALSKRPYAADERIHVAIEVVQRVISQYILAIGSMATASPPPPKDAEPVTFGISLVHQQAEGGLP